MKIYYLCSLENTNIILTEARKDGSITIEKNVITGIERKIFQLL